MDQEQVDYQPGQRCLECQRIGFDHKLRLFRISLTETLVKCESDKCLFPHTFEILSVMRDSEGEEEAENSLSPITFSKGRSPERGNARGESEVPAGQVQETITAFCDDAIPAATNSQEDMLDIFSFDDVYDAEENRCSDQLHEGPRIVANVKLPDMLSLDDEIEAKATIVPEISATQAHGTFPSVLMNSGFSPATTIGTSMNTTTCNALTNTGSTGRGFSSDAIHQHQALPLSNCHSISMASPITSTVTTSTHSATTATANTPSNNPPSAPFHKAQASRRDAAKREDPNVDPSSLCLSRCFDFIEKKWPANPTKGSKISNNSRRSTSTPRKVDQKPDLQKPKVDDLIQMICDK